MLRPSEGPRRSPLLVFKDQLFSSIIFEFSLTDSCEKLLSVTAVDVHIFLLYRFGSAMDDIHRVRSTQYRRRKRERRRQAMSTATVSTTKKKIDQEITTRQATRPGSLSLSVSVLSWWRSQPSSSWLSTRRNWTSWRRRCRHKRRTSEPKSRLKATYSLSSFPASQLCDVQHQIHSGDYHAVDPYVMLRYHRQFVMHGA